MSRVAAGLLEARSFFVVFLVAGCLFGACTPKESPKAPSPASRAERVKTLDQAVAPAVPEIRQPFSGEVVYKQTAVPLALSAFATDIGNLHYFVSGRHWKHVDGKGELTALYDPDAHVIHYFKPERRIVNASQSMGEATFVAGRQKKTILGRECLSYRMTSGGRSIVSFYDPTLYIDPESHTEHHWGHWAESLAFSDGGISLWSEVETEWGYVVSEAIEIRYMEFDAGFWAVPAEAQSEIDGAPATLSP
jgi:hypothetical protein